MSEQAATTQIVSARLLALPGEIAQAERRLLEAEARLWRAQEALEDKQARLILDGAINGKNAEERAAQLRAATAEERHEVGVLEGEARREKAELRCLKDELAAMRALARIIRGGDDD